MPKLTKIETVDNETPVVQEEVVTTSKTPTSFKVRDINHIEGYHIREFSEKIHGRDYKTLAGQFAETNAKLIIE